MPAKITAVIPAAGLGKRMGNRPKQYLQLEGRELLWWTLKAITASEMIGSVCLVVPLADVEAVKERYTSFGKVDSVISGGAARAVSVSNGVKATEAEIVVIHDAARPCLTTALLERTIVAAQKHGAATAAIRATDTLKLKDGQFLGGTIERENILQVQTPQVFKRTVLLDAYTRLSLGTEWTDETSMLQSIGVKVAWVEGEQANIKVTTPADLELAGSFLAGKNI